MTGMYKHPCRDQIKEVTVLRTCRQALPQLANLLALIERCRRSSAYTEVKQLHAQVPWECRMRPPHWEPRPQPSACPLSLPILATYFDLKHRSSSLRSGDASEVELPTRHAAGRILAFHPSRALALRVIQQLGRDPQHYFFMRQAYDAALPLG